MPLSLEQRDGRAFVLLSGEVGIASAVELKRLLIEAFASGKAVGVDMQKATEFDITALQLLSAAAAKAKGMGIALTLAGPVPPDIRTGTSDAGFEVFPIAIPGGQV